MTLWSAVLLVLLCAAAPVPGQHGLPEGADEVIETTLESYRTGDTEAYASCLAPDFVFVLHENPRPIFDADPPLLWDREAELLVHAELFGGGGDAPTVLSVDLHPYGAYETVTDETGAELLIVKLRGSVDAEIRGVLFRCATGHVLYLREPAGEVDDWKIVRWEEIDPHLPDIYYEAQGISEEPWCRVAESTARLYWYGHEFEGPIEFSMQGRHLTINGQPVPLHHALSCRPEDVPVTPYMQLDRRADAASTFDEWAQIYEESALVEGLALGGQSMTFRWVGRDYSYTVTRTYSPEALEHQPPDEEEVFRSWIDAVARFLEQGNDVWSHGSILHTRAPGATDDLPGWALDDMANPLTID